MELRHLRYFEAVAEELNFRRAALRLNVTQPSLSTQIRQLEEQIDARLLERNTQRVSLTPAGRQFLDDCRGILRDANESVRKVRRISRGEAGQLSIGFVTSLGHGLLPGLLCAYRKRFPQVDLLLAEMDTTQQIEALTARRIDLGFIGLGLPRETSELHLALVAKEKLVAALPADHALGKSGKPLPLRALAEERFLLSARQNAPIYNPWVIALCQQAGFQPHDVQETGQPMTVLNYVAAGLGVTLLPAQFSRLPTVGVRFVPLASPAPIYRYYAAWSPQNEHSALLQFVKFLRPTTRRLSASRGVSDR